MKVSLIDIENHFEPGLLQEGLDLVRATNEFSIQQPDQEHYQVNSSSPPYQVDLTLLPEGFVNAKCHCMPFKKTRRCKHVVAASYLLRDHLIQKRKKRSTSDSADVEEALRKMKITELREFLIQYARSHASFKADLLAHTLHLTRKPDYKSLLANLTPIDKFGQTKLNRNNIKTLRGIVSTLLKQAQELFRDRALPETLQILDPVITRLYKLIQKFPQYQAQLTVELKVALKLFESLCLQPMAPRMQQAAIKMAEEVSERDSYFFIKNMRPLLRSVEPFILEEKARKSILDLVETKIKTDEKQQVHWGALWIRWTRLWALGMNKQMVAKLEPILTDIILEQNQYKDYEDLIYTLEFFKSVKMTPANRKVSLQLGLRAAIVANQPKAIEAIGSELSNDYFDLHAWNELYKENAGVAEKIVNDLARIYSPAQDEVAEQLILHGLSVLEHKKKLLERLRDIGDADLMAEYDHMLTADFQKEVIDFYSTYIKTMKETYGGVIARQKLNNIFSHLKARNLYAPVAENVKLMDAHRTDNESDGQIAGFVFDLDGVIVDTAVHHFQSWKKLMKEEGVDIADEDDHHTRGASRMESLEYLLNKYGVKKTEEEKIALATRKNEYYLSAIEQITPDDLLPGALQFLIDSRTAGLSLALGSASKNARGVLTKLGIESRFDAILDGNDAEQSKPHPEIFLKASQALNLDPAKVVVFEDAAKGVQAALSAGCHCVGLGDPSTLSDADIVIPDLTAMTPQEIIESLS